MDAANEILNPDALLAQAQAQTGLTDWGDDTFPERFGLAVGYIQRAGMDEAGQRAGAANCLWLLTSRLQFFEDFKRYPIGERSRKASVRDRRGSRRDDFSACASLDRSKCARATFLGDHVPLAAARFGRTGRSAAGARGRRLERHHQKNAEVADQPPLQRHARQRSTGM